MLINFNNVLTKILTKAYNFHIMGEVPTITPERGENLDHYEEISSFLGINLDIFELDHHFRVEEIVAKLEAGEHGFEGIMGDERPFLFLERAVIFKDQEGKECIATYGVIPETACEGHLPGKKMIPHIHIARIMALSGRLLSAFSTLRNKIVPEAVDHGRGGSSITGEEFKYLKPPGKILAFARAAEITKRRVETTDNHAWIVAPDRLVDAGYMDGIGYSIIPDRVHTKMLEGN